MKVAHFTILTPRRCGLYETTRELVAALRAAGVDSRLVDPLPDSNPEPQNIPVGEDRGAKIADLEWAESADIFVSHSGIGKLEKTGKPIIHVAHGRPYHSFLAEASGGTAIYSFHQANNTKPAVRNIITFWPQHIPYLEVMYPDKPVQCIQSPVDLDYWRPQVSNYDFKGNRGGVNIICTDAFRDDINCYEPINAYALWARKNKQLNPKLHIFGAPIDLKGWRPLLSALQNDGTMGLIQGWTKDLRQVYNASDVLLTAHDIDVRSVRESAACGCPTIRIRDITTADISAGLSTNRATVRNYAEKSFNPTQTATQFKRVIDDIAN